MSLCSVLNSDWRSWIEWAHVIGTSFPSLLTPLEQALALTLNIERLKIQQLSHRSFRKIRLKKLENFSDESKHHSKSKVLRFPLCRQRFAVLSAETFVFERSPRCCWSGLDSGWYVKVRSMQWYKHLKVSQTASSPLLESKGIHEHQVVLFYKSSLKGDLLKNNSAQISAFF